jgi:hypothetical protein
VQKLRDKFIPYKLSDPSLAVAVNKGVQCQRRERFRVQLMLDAMKRGLQPRLFTVLKHSARVEKWGINVAFKIDLIGIQASNGFPI